MYVLFRGLTDGKVVGKNYWHSPEFFEIDTDVVSVSSLEWTHTSPPEFHTYNELVYLVD
jgi:hypothetical protein